MLALVDKSTGGENAPLKLTTLLTQMAEEPNSVNRAVMGSIINLTQESTGTLMVVVNFDAGYSRVTDLESRAIQLKTLKKIYTSLAENKAHWHKFRPKIAKYATISTIAPLIEAYDSYVTELERLVNERMGLPDLQWTSN